MMVPDGWSEEKLGDLFEFKNGANTEAINYGVGTKFVNVMDIFLNDSLTCDKIRGSVNLPENKIALYILKMGDVLFNRTSEVFDEIALSTVYLDSQPAIFGGFVIRGRPSTGKLDPTFCIYCFSSDSVRKELIRRGQGAIRANIGQADMKHVPLLVPSILEQTKIANILSTWDKAIETVEKLIDNSHAQKKALMQQLLTGKKRLPGFNGKWKDVKLSSAANITMGSSPKSEAYNHEDSGLPLLQGNADIKNRESAPRIHTSQITKTCNMGDVLLSVRAPVGEVAISKHHACIGRGIASLSDKLNTDNSFLYQSLLFKEPYWSRLSQGSTFDCVNSTDIKNLHIFSPHSKDEKQKVASILNRQDLVTKNLTKQLAKLHNQKKALMQQLLTGKRRVTLGDSA